MKKIDPHKALATQKATQSETNGSGTTLNANSVELIFKTFSRRWTHKWAKNFEDDKARQLWLIDLRKLEITDDLVQVGLKNCVEREWPPCAKEFADYCLPSLESLGIPDVVTAYNAAANGNYLHPVAFHATKDFGFYELRNYSRGATYSGWKEIFDGYCLRARKGETFTMPEREKLPDDRKPPDPEIAKAHLKKMAEIVGN